MTQYEDNEFSIYQSNSNIFRNTLPHILEPYEGDSLFGYLLRLDITNNFPTGTVLDMIKKHTTGKTSLNRPGLFLCGTVFDLCKLSSLVNKPIECVTNTTLGPTIKRIFRANIIYPQLAGYSTNFKICPLCIKENRLPMIHVFEKITACLEHNIKLQNKCICGHKVVFFSPKSIPLCCPICNYPYNELRSEAIILDSEEYRREAFYLHAYRSIIYENTNFVNENEDLAEGFEARLQYLSNINSISPGDFKYKFGYDASNTKNGHGLFNLSLAKIIDMLLGLGQQGAIDMPNIFYYIVNKV